MLYAIIQQLAVVLIVLFAAGYAFCSLAPRSAAHLRVRIGRRILRAGGSPRLRAVAGRWILEAAASAPHCYLCASCSVCAPEKTRQPLSSTRQSQKR